MFSLNIRTEEIGYKKGKFNCPITFVLILILCLVSCTTSKKLDLPALKYYQFEEIASLMKKEERPIAIFLHTKWCQYCRNMEQTTFQNKEVIDLLNERYYFISFDGETIEEINFRNHIFKFEPKGNNVGTHALAKVLGTKDGVLTYPNFIMLNSKYEIIFHHNAFINAKTLINILSK